MITINADLNELSNPQIYYNNKNQSALNTFTENSNYYAVLVERSATNVSIRITPSVVFDISNTTPVLSTINTALSGSGLTATIDAQGILISGTSLNQWTSGDNSDNEYSGTNAFQNAFGQIDFRDSDDNVVETFFLAVTINESVFQYRQVKCSKTVHFTYQDSVLDLENPLDNYGIADRGLVEYQAKFDSTWVTLGSNSISVTADTGFTSDISGSYEKAPVSYSFCETYSALPVRVIRTIRAIPNCGGTSPIIYQSIGYYNTTNLPSISIKEIDPSATWDDNFKCCIAEDSELEVTPSLTLNNTDSNINNPCENGKPNLRYNIYNPDGTEVLLLVTKTGTITCGTSSPNVVGVGTTFTGLAIGTRLYNEDDELIGVVKTITDNLNLVLEANAEIALVGEVFQGDQYHFVNPTSSSIFNYIPTERGTFKLLASLTNCCSTITKEWLVNICNSYIVEKGTCNNPKIKNVSATNFVKFTIKTYNSLNVVDSVTQQIILNNQLVSPLSEILIPKLEDGFYQLIIQVLDSNAEVISSEEQILFYDCNVKSCEVYLRGQLWKANLCVDCPDKKESEKKYKDLILVNDKFQIIKDILYSYWDNTRNQQSLPESWDIEGHLQKIMTYTEALKNMKKICESCGMSFTGSNVVYASNSDCGCSN